MMLDSTITGFECVPHFNSQPPAAVCRRVTATLELFVPQGAVWLVPWDRPPRDQTTTAS
jgi:hypothetical protein